MNLTVKVCANEFKRAGPPYKSVRYDIVIRMQDHTTTSDGVNE